MLPLIGPSENDPIVMLQKTAELAQQAVTFIAAAVCVNYCLTLACGAMKAAAKQATTSGCLAARTIAGGAGALAGAAIMCTGGSRLFRVAASSARALSSLAVSPSGFFSLAGYAFSAMKASTSFAV